MASDLPDRVVPDLEARLEEGVRAFRETHSHPANLAMHLAGWLLAVRGSARILRGRMLGGLTDLGLAAGLLVAGHRIEGNEPFQMLRRLREEYVEE